MLLHAFPLLLASFAISGCYAAIGPVANINVVNKVISPDGFSRSTVLAGGTFPGPLITANKGDNFRLNVTDSLTDPTMLRSTSIHWHGLLQAHTNYDDGAAFVTQCPIVPSHSYLYNFNVPDQAGTFWYHSHLSLQYCDGLRGPLVVYDPHDPHKSLYDVDDESTLITLSDWFHTPTIAAGPFAFPDSTLINGLGRYEGGDPHSPLAVVNVQHGKRYRMRLISMACHPLFNFTIDGHNMTIIEADGENTQPLTVDFIQILAGQRYSFILEAKQPINNYWIRASTSLGPGGFVDGINSAILRYAGAKNNSDPKTTQSPSVIPLNESNLHRLDQTPVPGKHELGAADVNLRFDFTFNGTTFFVNGTTFVDPTLPVLLQILSGARKATDLLPQGSVFTLPRNKVVELTLPGGLIAGPHPFHLHGHAFDVVQSAGASPNFVNPVRRDTVNIGDTGDEVVIRFVTDNPGPWFFHCHIDYHLSTGLALIFAEDPDDTAAFSPVTAPWKQLCPTYQALNPDHF